jgi:hypothetical protein
MFPKSLQKKHRDCRFSENASAGLDHAPKRLAER